MSFDSISNTLAICDKEQLNKYLNDDDALDILVKSSDEYQQLLAEKERLQQQNKRMAEENLRKQPILENVKTQLLQALKEFENAKKDYLTQREIFNTLKSGNGGNGEMTLETVCSLLSSSAERAEEDTDKRADQFFNQSRSLHTDEELADFQREFLEARTQAHIKKIKADKMKELMNSKQY